MVIKTFKSIQSKYREQYTYNEIGYIYCDFDSSSSVKAFIKRLFKGKANHPEKRTNSLGLIDYYRIKKERIPWNEIDYNEKLVKIEFEESFADMILKHLETSIFKSKVATAGMKEILQNTGLAPSEIAYKKLRGQIKYGRNYTSRAIDNVMNYTDCISIGLASLLEKAIDDELIKKLLCYVKLEDVSLTEKFKIQVVENITKEGYKKEFVAGLLYDKAMKNAEEKYVSYEGRFNEFLNNCKMYFDINNINVEGYIFAFKNMLVNAIEYTMRRNYTWKEDPSHE